MACLSCPERRSGFRLVFNIWLVVSIPLKNMKVRLDHHPSYWGSHKIHVPNHQPDIFNICPVLIAGKNTEPFSSTRQDLPSRPQSKTLRCDPLELVEGRISCFETPGWVVKTHGLLQILKPCNPLKPQYGWFPHSKPILSPHEKKHLLRPFSSVFFCPRGHMATHQQHIFGHLPCSVFKTLHLGGVPCENHRQTEGVHVFFSWGFSLECHGNVMGISWECHGNVMIKNTHKNSHEISFPSDFPFIII